MVKSAMDYQKHYSLIIERARGRKLVGYVEHHHVIPRCMGGADNPENIVLLTPEEHMVAHQLLAKIYKSHTGIAFAALMMAKRISNKKYGWLRRVFAQKIKIMDRSNWKTKEKKTEEHKRKISDGVRKSWATPEIRQKKIASMKGRVLSNQHKAALSEARKGTKLSEEHKKKIGFAVRGKKFEQSKLTCVHCGKTGGVSNMKRYHFDFCKKKPENKSKPEVYLHGANVKRAETGTDSPGGHAPV